MRTDASQSLQPLTNIAAQSLREALDRLAKRRTNAVLEVLAHATTLVPQRHYPADDLRFGGAPLRAYYHCHEYSGRDDCEHGHFHLFVRPQGAADERGQYSHLAALAMDHDGQPLSWLALNHWVAGGRWMSAAALATRLGDITLTRALDPAEAWLAAMVSFYQNQLTALLHARDAAYAHHGGFDAVCSDRNIYLLAQTPIALRAELEQALAGVTRRRGMVS